MIGVIKPTPKMVDQFFNTSTGDGDMGEKDLLGPWNDNDSVERVDAPAFQELKDPDAGTRKAAPIEGPELGTPVEEAAPPQQKDPIPTPAKRTKSSRR
jgi:Mn-containing catalase